MMCLHDLLETMVSEGAVPGAAALVARSTRTVGIFLTQLQMTGPTPTPLMRAFWHYAFGVP